MALTDNTEHYGIVSKVFHWGIALLLLWQFLSASAHFFFEDTAIEAFFWPTHKPLGVILLMLMVLRLIWYLINRANRPQSVSPLAKLGHITMYLLITVIPIVALLRQYGSGRTFELFGVTIFPGFEGEKIQWMLDLGSDFHGELGWVLLLLIIGHIFMTYVHQKSPTKQNVLSRMWK